MFTGAATGTMAAGSNSLTLAQGTGATTSVLGVGGSSAPRADLVASGDGQVLWDNAGTLGFAILPYSKLSGAPTPLVFNLPLSLSGGAVSLGYDGTSVTLNGSNQLQVAALSGAIVKAAGATVTTQGIGSATSFLGVSGGSAARADIACSGDGNVAWDNAGTVVCAALPYVKLAGAPTLHYQTVVGFPQEPALDVGTASATGLSANDNSGVSTRLLNTLVTGLAGGQTVVGGTTAGDSLAFTSSTTTGSGSGFTWDGGMAFPMHFAPYAFQPGLIVGQLSDNIGDVISGYYSTNGRSNVAIYNTNTGASASAGFNATTVTGGNGFSFTLYGGAHSTSGLIGPSAGAITLTDLGIGTSTAALIINNALSSGVGIALQTQSVTRWQVLGGGALGERRWPRHRRRRRALASAGGTRPIISPSGRTRAEQSRTRRRR